MDSLPDDGGRDWTPSQAAALAAIRRVAAEHRPLARKHLLAIMQRAGPGEELLAAATESLKRHACVALHFHPDRVSNTGLTVAERLLAEGVYRSQFETGISNGSPTAFPGGDRDQWETQLFQGAYGAPGVRPCERPKYGSLQVFYFADGPSPRFGSCYLVLRPEVAARCTFTYGDSYAAPTAVGTIDSFDSIMAALLGDIAATGTALGAAGLTVRGFLEYLAREFPPCSADPARLPVGRNLDEYIEAQVHGVIRLDRDAERIVADPSYKGTRTGAILCEIGAKYEMPVEWHRGFVLAADEVPPAFRGPVVPVFARWVARIAGTKALDAATIGVAAASLGRNPRAWRRWGSFDDSLRLLRQLWHAVVKFGAPIC
mgnify:CR=1 FL=1